MRLASSRPISRRGSVRSSSVSGDDVRWNGDPCVALVFVVSLLAGCSSPSVESLDEEQLVRDVSLRGTSPESARETLDLLASVTDSFELDPLAAPTEDSYWHAQAAAYAPTVRAALRAWQAERAARAAAGLGPLLEVPVTLDEVAAPNDPLEIGAMTDVLALLGLGPRSWEVAAADRRVSAAAETVDAAIFDAAFALDGARVRLEMARRRESIHQLRLGELEEDARRISLLHGHGRIADAALQRVHGFRSTQRTQLTELSTDTLAAERELLLAAGIAVHASARLQRFDLGSVTPPPFDEPNGLNLLHRVPALRTARSRYAVAEARVRVAAAGAWPSLRLGPALELRPDTLLLGGMMSLVIPWPHVVAAELERADAERRSARDTLEALLTACWTDVTLLHRELDIAVKQRDDIARPFREAGLGAWRGARAALRVIESMEIMEEWMMAFDLARRGEMAWIDAEEACWQLSLRLRRASGSSPGLTGGHSDDR